MAAYRRVYDLRYLQADYQEPGSAPEPYARYSSMGYLYLYLLLYLLMYTYMHVVHGSTRVSPKRHCDRFSRFCKTHS